MRWERKFKNLKKKKLLMVMVVKSGLSRVISLMHYGGLWFKENDYIFKKRDDIKFEMFNF